MINSDLGQPKQKFEDTFSAETVLMETYFPKYHFVALVDPKTGLPNGQVWKAPAAVWDKIQKLLEDKKHSPIV